VVMRRRRGDPLSVSQALLLLALVALLVVAGVVLTAVFGSADWAWPLFGASLGCFVVAVAALGSRR
jgi:hypothetical protein